MTTTAGAAARDSGLAVVTPPGAAAAGAAAEGMTGRAADEAVTVLYHAHYAMLVRTAALLVGDVATAEDVVQDCFIAMHRAWWRLHDTSKALPYLRRAVINRSRSVLRHRVVADRHLPLLAPQPPSAEDGALAGLERSAVLAALRALPARQREVVVLRYYADLSEAQIAAAMGISKGAVNPTLPGPKTPSRHCSANQCWPGAMLGPALRLCPTPPSRSGAPTPAVPRRERACGRAAAVLLRVRLQAPRGQGL